MAGNTWSADAAGVAGILAMIDDYGNALEQAKKKFSDAENEGSSGLVIEGRTEMRSGWSAFATEREDVPRKLMWMLQHRCSQVIEASVAVLAGDGEMADTHESAAAFAESEWNILSGYQYNADQFPDM